MAEFVGLHYPTLHAFSSGDDVESFIRSHESVESMLIVDTLYQQLSELMRIRHPGEILTPERTQELIEVHLDGKGMVSYGNWVYYPWSHQLVHVLGESEFREVRTNRNQYKITPEEQAALAGKRVGIIGLSVGQSVAQALALERSFGELRLADYDVLDLSNLNRLRAGISQIGMPKTVICARQLMELDPYLNLKIYHDGIHDGNIDSFLCDGGKLDLLIEECDGLDVKVLARHKARSYGIPVLMETNDRGMLDIERFDLEPQRPLLHGLMGNLEPSMLKGLSQEQKIEYLLPMVGLNALSERMKASMIEVQSSIVSWPQLGSAVLMGGGIAGEMARKILLGQSTVSGRFYLDTDQLIPEPVREEEHAVANNYHPLTNAEVIAIREQFKGAEGGDSLPDAVRLELVRAAMIAPSGGNMQPWKLTWKDHQLLLIHDPYYSESFLDFHHLGSYFSFGAMLENLRIAAAHHGYAMHQRVFPDQSQPLLVAACRFVNEKVPELPGLFAAMWVRMTNRMYQERNPLPEALKEEMNQAAASSSTAKLHLVEDPDLLKVAGDILSESEVMLLLHPVGHEDMFHKELRLTEKEAEETRDGVDVATLKLSKAEVLALRVASSRKAMQWVSRVGGGDAFRKNTRKAIRQSSAIGMITMPFHTAEAYLHAGEIAERIWILAAKYGCSFQPMTQYSFLLARLNHGGGQGYSPDQIQLMQNLDQKFQSHFPEIQGRELVFLFRISSELLPSVRSLRRSEEKVYIH